MSTTKRSLSLVTFTYWFLLVYILVALFWWFISLEKQNKQIAALELKQLHIIIDSTATPTKYNQAKKNIHKAQLRKTYQYIGEGGTFLFIIFVGATFVYKSVRKQLKLSRQQKNFMMAVTHELKTPIAIAKLNLETLQKRKLEESQQQKLITNALLETNRLNDLCSNILVSAQLEGGAYKLHKAVINFSTHITDIAQDFTQRFPNRKIEHAIMPDLYIFGESLLLQLMVNNLVENALKYSAATTPVGIHLYTDDKKVILKITDNGVGIPEDEKNKIWDKFYRVGNENTRTTKGTGIGLYLCRIIAKDHQANIMITNNMPTGSIFTIQFPMVKQKAIV